MLLLNINYQTTITDTAVKVFWAKASVWLFGSISDDTAELNTFVQQVIGDIMQRDKIATANHY